MPDHLKPGDRIRALRKRTPKMTAQDVATAVGISRVYVSMIERNHDLPGRDTLQAIADFFQVSVDYILNGGDAAPASPVTREFIDDPDELALLSFWRGLDDDEKRAALVMLRPGRRRQ